MALQKGSKLSGAEQISKREGERERKFLAKKINVWICIVKHIIRSGDFFPPIPGRVRGR